MEFSIILDDVAFSKSCASSTLVEWFTILVFSLVVVASFVRDSFIVGVFVNGQKTTTVAGASISYSKRKMYETKNNRVLKKSSSLSISQPLLERWSRSLDTLLAMKRKINLESREILHGDINLYVANVACLQPKP